MNELERLAEGRPPGGSGADEETTAWARAALLAYARGRARRATSCAGGAARCG